MLAANFHPVERACDRVVSRREDDHVQLILRVRGLDSMGDDPLDGRGFDIDESNVVPVENFVVARLAGNPLGRERMVLWNQFFRYRRVFDTLPNFLPHEFAEVLVRRPGNHDILKIAQEFLEAGLRPEPLIEFEPLFLGNLHCRTRVGLMDKSVRGFPADPKYLRILRLQLAHGFRIDRSIAQRQAIVCRALKDREVFYVLGDRGDKLHTGSSRADNAYPLAREIHSCLRPPAGMAPLAFETVEAREFWNIVRRKKSHRGDEELSPKLLAGIGVNGPMVGAAVVDRRLDPGRQLNVAAQIEFVGDEIEVALCVGLRGIAFFPIPFLQQLF